MKLTLDQLDFYSENGYVIVQNLFSAEQIQEMSKLANEIAEESKEFPAEPENESDYSLNGAYVVLAKHNKSQSAINRVVWAAAAKPEFLRFGRSNNLLEPVSQLLYSDEADHLINQIHYKSPGDGVEFPWHQDEQNRRRFDPDWKDVNLKGSFVQTLTAIDPCTLHNGPLNVLPGSHHWGYLNFGGFLQPKELQDHLHSKKIPVEVNEKQIPLLMNPGDVAFMHPCLVHGSWPNKSSQSRRMFINGFSFPGANNKDYPGVGSSKRISLKTGEEIPVNEKTDSPSSKSRTVSTSRLALLSGLANNAPLAKTETDLNTKSVGRLV